MDKIEQIQALLDKVERQNKVKILLAVESGSRAWGFPSKDSDYDIRFIYHHDAEWYITAFSKRDVIDLVFVHDLDAGGWDVGKCMRLMHKGNAPLLEWLNSPIVYRSTDRKVELLRELGEKSFNPRAIFHHYVSLAKKKLNDERTFFNAKYFLYALRAILCAQWIKDESSIPPVEFEKLRIKYMADPALEASVRELLIEKQGLTEGDKIVIADGLIAFAQDLAASFDTLQLPTEHLGDTNSYDEVLRQIVSENPES